MNSGQNGTDLEEEIGCFTIKLTPTIAINLSADKLWNIIEKCQST